MKSVCHCYDGIARELNFVLKPNKDSDHLYYFGCLDDIKICMLSKNSDGWFYILLSNRFTDDRRIPMSVRLGYGFTSRKVCFNFVVNLIQVHKQDHKDKVPLKEFIYD